MRSEKLRSQQGQPNDPAPQQRQGTPIEYKEFLQHDSYVTGIAYYSNPNGEGNFRISISGPPEAVRRFASEGSIISMRVAPETDEDVKRMDELQAEACKRASERRWRQREANVILADKERNANLSDEERGDLERVAGEPKAEHDAGKPNFARDRVIQIEVLDKVEPNVPHVVSFHIDPPVAKGTCDIWSLQNGNVTETSASLRWTGGDPDMYLYLNSSQVGRSAGGPGQNEIVYGWGGPGYWQLHVYGYSDGSSYEIEQWDRWYQSANDVPNWH